MIDVIINIGFLYKPNITITLKHFVYIILLAIAITSCNVNDIVGSGVVITESRPITEFSELYVQGNYNVHIKQGNNYKLFLKMDDNLLDNTITEINGDELQIISNYEVRNSRAKDIYITVKKLDRIELIGSTTLINSNVFRVKSLKIISEGSCDLDLHVHASTVSLNLSGNSKAKLIGTSAYFDVDISGYGHLNSLGLFSDNVILKLSGSVSSKVFSANYLDVNISGDGQVYYKGTPELKVNSSRDTMVLPIKKM